MKHRIALASASICTALGLAAIVAGTAAARVPSVEQAPPPIITPAPMATVVPDATPVPQGTIIPTIAPLPRP